MTLSLHVTSLHYNLVMMISMFDFFIAGLALPMEMEMERTADGERGAWETAVDKTMHEIDSLRRDNKKREETLSNVMEEVKQLRDEVKVGI